jgi:hypothetical protein
VKIVERVRPSAVAHTRPIRKFAPPPSPRAEPAYENEAEIARLRRQLRQVTDRNSRAFDQGFAAAVDMVARGATLERLREASGVVESEWRDTEPVDVTELRLNPSTSTGDDFEEDTLVDAVSA